MGDIERKGNKGIGKPEPLTDNLTGFWSKRINDKEKMIYKLNEENVYILACRYHYGDKQQSTPRNRCALLFAGNKFISKMSYKTECK